MSLPCRPSDTGCAAVRARFAEPLLATAPERAASWLLVEHAGPWPATGLPRDLPAQAVAVIDRATEAGVRPQLIRPVSERRRGPTTVLLASCRPGATWIERRTLTDLRELDDLDVPGLAAGLAPGFGTPGAEAVVLVCTHGRRDVCCARLGRPLAVRLDAQLPGRVWETTHLGGDRFAPNVVTLPDGSCHGGLTASDVPALARAITSGRVLLPRLRGRVGLPAAVQAADYFARLHLGATALDEVRPVAGTSSPSGEPCVELLVGAARWCVHVAVHHSEQERLTSCAGDGTTSAPDFYDLVSLRRLA